MERHGETAWNGPEQPGSAHPAVSAAPEMKATLKCCIFISLMSFFSNAGCDQGLVTRFTYEWALTPPAERAEQANAAERVLARPICSRPKTVGTTTKIFLLLNPSDAEF